MRDPARIDRIVSKLRAAWKASPDLRLGQLVSNIDPSQGKHLYQVEDDAWEQAMPAVEPGLRPDWDDAHDTSGMNGYRPDPDKCQTHVSPIATGHGWYQCRKSRNHPGPCYVGSMHTPEQMRELEDLRTEVRKLRLAVDIVVPRRTVAEELAGKTLEELRDLALLLNRGTLPPALSAALEAVETQRGHSS